MTSVETISGLLDWANQNLTNTIGFIPEDKFDWKPAPTSKSALEIARHMTGVLNKMTAGIFDEPKRDLPEISDSEGAKQLISELIQTYVSKLKSLPEDQISGTVHLESGDVPMEKAIAMPIIESINHHGQFTYIQTLLGDDEDHLIN